MDYPDCLAIHESLFCAYDENWGEAREALGGALEHLNGGLSPATRDDWMRASAVYCHLDYGDALVEYLRETGYNRRLRPWFEALVAVGKGSREALWNVALEVRSTAEHFIDQIMKRIEILPEKTRRWQRTVGKKR